MSTGSQVLRFAEYLELPETARRQEVVDGVLLMPPAPSPYHQWIVQEIFVRLRSFVRERRLGVTLVAPVDLVIQREPLRARQPDVLYLSAERSGLRGLADLRGLQLLEIAPDLVVEVLSPANTRQQVEAKLEDYRRMGVQECWLVSPEAETIEVLTFSAGGTELFGLFGVDGVVRSRVLADFTFKLREIFR